MKGPLNAMRPLPILPEFIEEHLWALRDRADLLQPIALPQVAATTLAAVRDDLTELALLARSPIRFNRRVVAATVERVRAMLDAIERDAWPCGAPG